MTNNSNKTDTHIYNIINNPSPAFTKPCEACGVSEFQLGVRYAEERIIKLLQEHEAISDGSEGGDYAICVCQHWHPNAEPYVDHIEKLIRKGEQND